MYLIYSINKYIFNKIQVHIWPVERETECAKLIFGDGVGKLRREERESYAEERKKRSGGEDQEAEVYGWESSVGAFITMYFLG